MVPRWTTRVRCAAVVLSLVSAGCASSGGVGQPSLGTESLRPAATPSATPVVEPSSDTTASELCSAIIALEAAQARYVEPFKEWLAHLVVSVDVGDLSSGIAHASAIDAVVREWADKVDSLQSLALAQLIVDIRHAYAAHADGMRE